MKSLIHELYEATRYSLVYPIEDEAEVETQVDFIPLTKDRVAVPAMASVYLKQDFPAWEDRKGMVIVTTVQARKFYQMLLDKGWYKPFDEQPSYEAVLKRGEGKPLNFTGFYYKYVPNFNRIWEVPVILNQRGTTFLTSQIKRYKGSEDDLMKMVVDLKDEGYVVGRIDPEDIPKLNDTIKRFGK